ncbi:MAG: FISUMP domain-containing protein [Bacteroidota bacterium]
MWQISFFPSAFFLYGFWGLILIFSSSCSFSSTKVEPELKLEEISAQVQYGTPIEDTDGQIYKTITIGAQTWMAEDLEKTEIECDSNKQAKFENGLERGPGVKLYVTDPRYAWYKNNKALGYGVIYNFGVVEHCQLCPPGFRIPSKSDWEILIEEVGGRSVAAMALIENGSSGFNAKLGGRIDSYGSVLAGNLGFWWCSDIIIHPAGGREAYIFEIGLKGSVKLVPQPIPTGNYVRCIKE